LGLRLCSGQRALCTARGLGRERDRALEKGRGRGKAAARLRSRGGTFEFAGNLFVGCGRGLRAVPGAAIRVDARISGLRERAVDLASLVQTSGSVDGRADQWVPEHHSGRQRQPLFRFDGARSRLGDGEPFGGAPYQRRVADRVSGRDQQQASRVGRQRRQPSRIAALDPG
jgi:hypothetical protein